MSIYTISDTDQIYYLYHPPENSGFPTFVFFNPLTGDTNNWEAVIAPNLRDLGFGTLSYDYRGQAQSPFSDNIRLTSQSIVDDAVSLLDHVKPEKPVLVGLSIGGLYAAQAWLAGAAAEKLVLINTLREDNTRLKWIGDALVRTVEIGGLQLFRDLFLPLLMNQEWLNDNRDNFLTVPASYEALSPSSGHFKLLAEAGPSANWEIAYEKLDLPTLVITGLQDHVFLELDIVNKLFERLPQGQRIEMKNAGHLIPGERPLELVDILKKF